MRRHRFPAKSTAFAQNKAEDEGRPTGGHMDHCATSKIDCMDSGILVENAVHEPINSPNHVSLRDINDEHPKDHEQADGGELHALGNRADNQGRGDDRKHQLVHGKDVLRYPVRVVRIRTRIDSVEEGETQAAEKFPPIVKYQAVAADPPKDADHASDEQTL